MSSPNQSVIPTTSGDSLDKDKENGDLHKFLQQVRDGEDAKVLNKLENKNVPLSEVNKPDVNKLTAIQYAVLCNRPVILNILLEHGVDAWVRDNNGLSLAHHAAKIVSSRSPPGVSVNGNEQHRESTRDCLSVLIEHDRSKGLMLTQDNDGQTPMHYAVMAGNMAAVELLNKNDEKKENSQEHMLIYKGDSHKMTPLHVAASYGQIEIATFLLDNEAGYLKKDRDRNTPLHYACAAGNIEMTKLLLKKASSDKLKEFVDSQDAAGNTSLHLAAENGHWSIVRALIEEDASVMIQRKDGMYPHHLATVARNLDIFKELSQKKGDYTIVNNADSTPLHIAAEYNSKTITEHIIENQKKVVGQRDKDGNTALHIAARHGNQEIVKLLMAKEADLHAKNIQGRIPLHLAAERGKIKAFKSLLYLSEAEQKAGWSLDDTTRKTIEENLLVLSKSNEPDDTLVEKIASELQKGLRGIKQEENKFLKTLKVVVLAKKWSRMTDAETKEKGEPTKLKQPPTKVPKTTATNGIAKKTSPEPRSDTLLSPQEKIDMLPQILHAHTMINAEDLEVNTPLHLATRGGHMILVELILTHYFVEPNRKNDDERTPLHLAALHGRTITAQKVMGVSQNAVFAEDQKGNTPLHLAAQAGHKNTLEVLIQHKADIHHKNVDGRTALDLAASNGWEEICGLLVKVEAQSGLKYKELEDKSPLYLACQNGHVRVVKLLLRNNADVTAKSGDWNCLDVAVENDNRDVARLIINSSQWKEALQNNSKPFGKPEGYENAKKRVDTPMRRLIRRMPDVAWEVLEKCVTERQANGSKKKYTYDYQFIDDLYEDWTQKLSDNDRKERKEARREKPWKKIESYSTKARVIKKNHPLMIMVTHERDELLQHPIVIKLIKQKWFKFGAYYYLLTLIVHLLFLILLTRAIIQNKPPHEFSPHDVDSIKANTCAYLIDGTFESYWLPTEKFIMYALIALGILFEITQISTTKSAYFTNLESYVEWVVYILSFLYLLDFNNCTLRTGYREPWQWSLGAFALFFSWVDLVLYLKAFTSLGLYVIMFQLVCWTFLQVFVVFFSLIAAFALGFHTLLQNQVPFRDVANSILKTSVMFLGEIDYNDIFNSGVNITGQVVGEDENLRYPGATSVLFSAFILLAGIVLMNLLVGLAVDDIKGITRKAAFKRTAMHVELVLDVEKVLFESWRKSVYKQRKKQQEKEKEKERKQYENGNDKRTCKCIFNPWKWFLGLGIWWWNQTLEPDENVVLKQIPELSKRQEELHRSLEQMNKQLLVLNRRVLKVLLKQNQSDNDLLQDGLEDDEVVSRDDVFVQ